MKKPIDMEMRSPSLRERKKQKTRQTIQREAFRLFRKQGYESTSVEQIAAAAEVSPSTFFRYFATKEDVVMTDEHDDSFAVALRARPSGESISQSIRMAVVDVMSNMLLADREELLFQARLSFEVPALRARAADEEYRSAVAVAELLAERTGRSVDDLDVQCAAAMIIVLSSTVIRYWVQRDGVDDLVALYDRHLSVLSEGLHLE